MDSSAPASSAAKVSPSGSEDEVAEELEWWPETDDTNLDSDDDGDGFARSFFFEVAPTSPRERNSFWMPILCRIRGLEEQVLQQTLVKKRSLMDGLLKEISQPILPINELEDLVERFWHLAEFYPTMASIGLSDHLQERIECFTGWVNMHRQIEWLKRDLQIDEEGNCARFAELRGDLSGLLACSEFKRLMGTLEKINDELPFLKPALLRHGLSLSGDTLKPLAVAPINAVMTIIKQLIARYRPLFACPLYDPDLNLIMSLFRQMGQVVQAGLILKYLGLATSTPETVKLVEDPFQQALFELSHDLGEMLWRYYFARDHQILSIYSEETRQEMTAAWSACEQLINHTSLASVYLANLFG